MSLKIEISQKNRGKFNSNSVLRRKSLYYIHIIIIIIIIVIIIFVFIVVVFVVAASLLTSIAKNLQHYCW